MIHFAKIPHTVRILLTKKCNLNCVFCLIDASNKADAKELKTEEWLDFFEKLRQLRVFNILLNGGEIFLKNDLFILLNRLRENRMHKIVLFTNGTLIGEETALGLSRLKIKNISISLDGLEENHDKLRGRGAFQKTMEGIRNLTRSNITPQITFTPMKSNYRDLGPLIDVLIPEGIKVIQVNSLSPEGRCLNIYADIALEFPTQIKEVLDVVKEKRTENPDSIIDCNLGFHYHLPQSYMYFKENPQNFQIKHLKDGCGAATTSCTIMPNGDVIPCEGLPMLIGGNIREREFMDIWNNSENLKKIRELSKIAMDQVPYCKNCKYIFLCDGGCRASAYLVYGDLLAPGINCPLWMKDKTSANPVYRNDINGEGVK